MILFIVFGSLFLFLPLGLFIIWKWKDRVDQKAAKTTPKKLVEKDIIEEKQKNPVDEKTTDEYKGEEAMSYTDTYERNKASIERIMSEFEESAKERDIENDKMRQRGISLGPYRFIVDELAIAFSVLEDFENAKIGDDEYELDVSKGCWDDFNKERPEFAKIAELEWENCKEAKKTFNHLNSLGGVVWLESLLEKYPHLKVRYPEKVPKTLCL